MTSKTTQKGINFERELMKMLEDYGFEVTRSAGSHSPFDVIAWKRTPWNNKIIFASFIQCKVTGRDFVKEDISKEETAKRYLNKFGLE